MIVDLDVPAGITSCMGSNHRIVVGPVVVMVTMASAAFGSYVRSLHRAGH